MISVKKPQIKEGQVSQWLNERMTKRLAMVYNTLLETYRLGNMEPIKTGGYFKCSGTVSSSCSIIGTRRVTAK
jgi:hypothetical protein